MLELIMEASGASQLVSDSLKIIRQQSSQALMDDIEGVTGLVATKFRNLKKKLNAKQNIELEKRKYTFMDKEQLHFMYSDRDLFPSLPPKLTDMFGNRSEYDHKQLLDTLIESLAHRPKRDTEKKDEKKVEEEKQQGGVFLSPFAFSPTIAQLTVLGPIILSPSIFSPAILGPAVLSPPILSPQVGNPLILSPYVLGPNILSAAVFNPYVLSPYVLSPNLLNPYVLSPLILSPHVLSPDILSPVVLSGTILNPYVMSPAILSDSIIGVDILSPSVLSR
uniref:Uncharacterized protein n=1 Tax=Ditylenchus dipsaci TaxID=166011 RepID=A0A915EKL4_9BILA